jgi:uncharacterized surface protein with fasciclin (FAS1) repeats
MRLRTFLATAVVAAFGGGLLTAAAASATTPPTQPTLAEILAASGPIGDRDWYDFDIINGVVGAILAADTDNNSPLRLALDPNSPKLTVFLPNDRAFQALAADLLGWKYWFAHEGKVAEGLLGAIDIATLETVVLYHVHVGYVDSATALSVPRNFKLPMVAGGEIGVTPVKWLKTAVLTDNDPNDANPTLVRSKLDIRASNGIAHGISFVLRPVDL